MYRRLEAWGYPRVGIDWLKRRKLLTIVILAGLSWALVLLVFLGIADLAREVAEMVQVSVVERG